MLKRLIIAVFGICLILAIGSIALAAPFPGVVDEPENMGVNPDHPRFDDAHPYSPTQPTFKKPESAIKVLPPGTPTPAPPSLLYFGELQGYAGAPANYWTLPNAYGDNLINTRFTVADGFEYTLQTAHLLMYRPAMVGSPSLRVYLWDDDGFGFPGNLLDSITISNSALPTAAVGYARADFSAASWVFADGEQYHYGWTTVGAGTLAVVSDNGSGPAAGAERSSERYQTAWGSMLNDW